jgi:branched-chain amino acid transport system ATP-binding protein
MLRLDNVSAGYGAVTALRNVDIIVEAGEVVALIGSNGAGKSTALRTVSGLVRPTAGSIEFQGEAITNLSPEQIVARGIVHVPEGRRLSRVSRCIRILRSAPIHRARTARKMRRANACSNYFPDFTNAAGSSLDR